MIPLVDISHHQGQIDWDAFVAAAPEIPGVIIRAGNGQSKDTRVDRNMAEAKRVGLLRSAYWFANPKAPISGAGQGRLLADAHHTHGCELPPMWDVEDYSLEGGPNPILAGAPMARWVADMVHTTDDNAGVLSLGYSGASYWNRAVAPGSVDVVLRRFTAEWQADLEFLYLHDFILSRYPGQHRVPPLIGKVVDYLPRGVHPAAWEQVAMALGKEPPALKGQTRTWDAWQWSAGGNAQGPVYGCQSSDLDLNIVRPEAWARWTSQAPIPPPPTPPQEADMAYVIFELVDSNAAFWGETNRVGGPVMKVRWTGEGGPGWDARRKQMTDEETTEVRKAAVGNLKTMDLEGALPPGYTGDEFANAAEIKARNAPAVAVDEQARAGVAYLKAQDDAKTVRDERLRAALAAAGNS